MRDIIVRARPFVGLVRAGSVGSGFLLRDTNKLVTCEHVIGGASAEKITVRFEDRESKSHVEAIESYPKFDLAILSLSPEEVPQGGLELGKFDDVEPGDDLLILGFPAGYFELTAIRGLASAKSRLGEVNVLKLDAAVIRGLSGSPCFHVSTRKVIGVVSLQVPALAVLDEAISSVKSIRQRADSLINAARQASQVLGARAGGVFISGIDPLQSTAAVLAGIADIAKDLRSFSDAIEEFAKGIPLGLGYAISIDHLRGALGR